MNTTLLAFILWIAIFIVFYAYLGYGILLFMLVKVKRLFNKRNSLFDPEYCPFITFMVAAFNEEDFIEDKIKNSLSLNYPPEKIQFLFVTDGSNDSTTDIINKYPSIELLHKDERKGKIAAVHRAMQYVKGEVIIFSDANTTLNKEAIKKLARHFQFNEIGAVAGEKKIESPEKDQAVGAGEGFYWKYESKLKTWDSYLHSVVGAAGELFAIRASVYEPVPQDTLIEDFYMTLKIAMQGKRVVYEPEAYASESPSFSIKEELKRKIRIAAGGIQAIVRLKALLNPFKYGVLTFQYVSHRVLRWTLAPLLLPFIFILNFLLAFDSSLYQGIFVLQTGFYMAALVGYLFERKQIRFKLLYIPYYFFIMNYAVYAGFKRYLSGKQNVVWDKAKRKAKN